MGDLDVDVEVVHLMKRRYFNSNNVPILLHFEEESSESYIVEMNLVNVSQ